MRGEEVHSTKISRLSMTFSYAQPSTVSRSKIWSMDVSNLRCPIAVPTRQDNLMSWSCPSRCFHHNLVSIFVSSSSSCFTSAVFDGRDGCCPTATCSWLSACLLHLSSCGRSGLPSDWSLSAVKWSLSPAHQLSPLRKMLLGWTYGILERGQGLSFIR